MIEDRRPNIVVVEKVKKETTIIDVAIPGDTWLYDKEREKIEKYSLLKDEIARLQQMKKVVVIPIVVGALGTIKNKVWQVYWKPSNGGQNWTCSEISIVRNT